jgi:hypothetical protein
MTIKEQSLQVRLRCGQELMAAGGMLGSLAASSCCILPLVLFSLESAEHGSRSSRGLRRISPISSRRHFYSWDTAIGWFTDQERAPARRVRPARGPCQIES